MYNLRFKEILMWLSEEIVWGSVCVFDFDLWLDHLIYISNAVKWQWKRSQKYQVQCAGIWKPSVSQWGSSKGVNSVDSFNKGVNLEPSSEGKQYHLPSASEEAGMTVLWDLYYFSDGRGWGYEGKVRENVGRNQMVEIQGKWREDS